MRTSVANVSSINIPGADGRLQSVGIIMDGNGRWAKARGLSRSEGHKAGAKVIEEVIKTLNDLGLKRAIEIVKAACDRYNNK